MRSLLIAATLTTGALLFGGVGSANAADSTVTVTPADITAGTSWFTGDTRIGADATATGATGAFSYGPATPPLGRGSFKLGTPTSNAKVQLLTNAYDGVRLDAIQGIGFSTFQDVAPVGSPAMVAMNLRVSLGGGPVPDAYLVYEPYMDFGNAALTPGVWQSWDAFRGGAAKWWINTGAGGCGQMNADTNCTWNTIKTLFPNATIREGVSCGNGTYPKPSCPGSLGLNQGSGNPGIVAEADALYVTTGGNKTTYNLEPTSDTTKPTCGEFVIRRGGGPGGADQADVTLHDTGSGIGSITNFTATNGSMSIAPFSPGASSVTLTATKTEQGVNTHFEFDVTDVAGNTTHCA